MAAAQQSKNDSKLKRKAYDKQLERLHGELVRLQQWVVHAGLKVCIVFEGRDGAGKGGTIKAITERVSPRVFRVVALPAPSDRQKSHMYLQRYVEHFPAGVEYVMEFCTPEQHQRFLELTPIVEKFIVDGGIRLIKIWLEVGQEEQEK